MQTFLPYPSFTRSAKCLDNKRLGKQRVEVLQILNTLKKGPITNGKKTPWYNHPAVKMWRDYEPTLIFYGLIICHEWVKRGNKDTCFEKIITHRKRLLFNTKPPAWLHRHAFHASHRSNLLRKDPEWYGQFGWKEPDNLPYVWPV